MTKIINAEIIGDIIYDNASKEKKIRMISRNALINVYERLGGEQGLVDLAATGPAGAMFVYNLIFKHAPIEKLEETRQLVPDVPWVQAGRLSYKYKREFELEQEQRLGATDAVVVSETPKTTQ